jgi:predicted phosphodiesterase
MKALLLSDIHGNWPALQAVMHVEADANQIICLGDLVNYGPQPAECVAWAMQLTTPSLVVQGNEDRAFGLGKPPNCSPAYQHVSEAVQAATSPLLTAEMRRFLAKLPASQRFCLGEATCVACHSTANNKGPIHPFPGTPSAAWPWESDLIVVGHPDRLFIVVEHPNLLFVAHTHRPFQTDWMNTAVVNPGSVGKPLDGDPRAAYGVWEDGVVTLRRAVYDVEETVWAYDALALEHGIRRQLVEELRSGVRLAAHEPQELTV